MACLTKLLRLLRLAKLLRILERYEEEIFLLQSFFDIMAVVFMMFFVAHVLCCMWYTCG